LEQKSRENIDGIGYKDRIKLYAFLLRHADFANLMIYPFYEFRRFVKDYLFDMIKRHDDLLSWLVFAKIYPQFIYPYAYPDISLTDQSITEFKPIYIQNHKIIKSLNTKVKINAMKHRKFQK